ncbi:MAG TPA: DUF6599 family protein, partial [Bryobacteraceae bacterium]
MHRFLFLLAVPLLASAAILPDTIGAYHRTSSGQPAISDQAVWDEYGLKASETGAYENGASQFTATVWQLQDTTGSMAAFDWQRPKNATQSKVASMATETPDGLLLVHGNYLFSFQGYKPTTPELDTLAASLKNVDEATLPSLPGFLPSTGLQPNSERYITGPASLEKFAQGIPPSTAAFSLGAEAVLGIFRSPKGEMPLAIFNYPTAQMAMQKIEDFQKLPGARAKRSGPLVAVILNPQDADAAERLLGEVRYQAAVTRDERIPTRKDNIGDLIVNAFVLIGILLVFSVVSGFFVGGFRTAFRRFRKTLEPEAM